MSDLFVSTTFGDFVLAAKTPSGIVEKPVKDGDRIESFFKSFSQIAEEIPISQMRRIFLDIGPGSYIGVKVGVVFARVLSQNLRIPIFPVKATDIMGEAGPNFPKRWVSPVFDSGNGFVYATLFENGRKKEADYIIPLDEWLDFAEGFKGDMLLRIRLGEEAEAKVRERNFEYEKIARGAFLEKMVSLSAREIIASKIYQEVVPFYINRKDSAELWQRKLEGEMEKIRHLREERDKILIDIDRLERIKAEKEDEISSLNELLEKKQFLQREIEKSMEEISILNAKRAAYEESLKEKENMIAALSEKTGKMEDKIRELEEKIKQKQDYLEKLKNLPPEIPQEVELYLEQRDSLKKEVEELKAEKEKYTKELDEVSSSRFEEVFERIRNEEKILEDVSKMREEKEAELGKLSEELERINSEKKEKEAEIEEMNRKIEELNATVQEKPVEKGSAPEFSAEEAEATDAVSENATEEPAQPEVPGEVSQEEIKEAEASEPEEGKPEEAAEKSEEEKKAEEEPSAQPAEEKFEVAEEMPLKAGKIPEIKLENFRYSLRPFRMADLPKVMEIEEASFERPWRRQMFKEELSIPVSKLYTINGTFQDRAPIELMGYAVFWVVNEKAHIINFAVDPKERRKGVGKVMLVEILKKAKSLGCRSAYLEVRVSAKGCQKLFEWAGFVGKGVRKDYFGYPKEDGIIYERPL